MQRLPMISKIRFDRQTSFKNMRLILRLGHNSTTPTTSVANLAPSQTTPAAMEAKGI